MQTTSVLIWILELYFTLRLGNTNCSVAREILLGRVGLEVSRELTQRRVMSEEEREFGIKRVLKGKQYITSVSVKILGRKGFKQQRQQKRHMKINIWDLVTILWLLPLPRILYCWQRRLQMDWQKRRWSKDRKWKIHCCIFTLSFKP